MNDVIALLFTQPLMVCDGMNLIGREIFAIDQQPEITEREVEQITAISSVHSEANMKMINRLGINCYIANNQFRKRDPRFID